MTSISLRGGDSPDTVRQYLNEIGKVDLLTAEKERELGKRIKDGLRAEERLQEKGDALEISERRELKYLERDGRKAQDEMVRANLRLVVSIARRYDRKELQLADLIQEGNIGLMHAAKKYDHEKGFKFSTYATWWIRQAMTRAMADQGRNIRIPGHMMEIVNRVQRVERELTAELNRGPSPEEVSARAGISVDELLKINQLTLSTTSLDAPIGIDTDDLTVGDTIATETTADPLRETMSRARIEMIEKSLEHLPERERRILSMRFGLGQWKEKPHTLEEVAVLEGITRERVRQIEQKSLSRLRHPNNKESLRSFIDDE